MGYYLAIDIGDEIGQLILGHLEDEKLRLEEIYRFQSKDGEKFVDITRLFDEIKFGMNKCREDDKLPIFIGIDTSRTDFVLLDQEDSILGNMISFNQKDNIIHQLTIMKEYTPNFPEKVKTLLMLPDYLNFLLTGVKLSEYTTAMTTQLVDSENQMWKVELIEKLGYSADILQEIRRPGAVLGNLTRKITEDVGYDCIIVLPATNADSSAVFAFPSKEYKDELVNLTSVSLIGTDGIESKYSAAAIGNLLVQMIISHEIKDVQAAHECIKKSFVIK